MTNDRTTFRPARHHRRAWWTGLLALGFCALVFYANRQATAAPVRQTVPPRPTATPTDAPVATSTPRNDDGDSNDKGSGSAAPSPTPNATPNTGAAELTGVVTVARLNVRQEAGTNFPVIGVVLRGETVRILERNPAGTWWRICCVSGGQAEGWVSAQFIRPNFTAAEAQTLIPVAGVAQTTAAPTAVAPNPTAAITTALTTTVANTTTSVVTATTPTTLTMQLEFVITQQPPNAWQGQEIELHYLVTNPGAEDAANVEVRNEFPTELIYLSASAGADGQIEQQSSAENHVIWTARWPTLSAGQSITATVHVQIAADLPDGAVVDNLAVVGAENAAAYTAGITVGMPPAILPDFQ